MKIFSRTAAIVATAIALTACGQRVEVPPASVAKIMTSDGYKKGIINTSRFRLDSCVIPGSVCDRLVLLSVGDLAQAERIELVMPKDRLKMTFDLQMTLTLNPKKYDEMFTLIPPVASESGFVIDRMQAYRTYAQQVALTEAREYISQYSIDEVISNLERINADMTKQLTKSLSEKTPFIPRFIGITNPKYPEVIVDAQVNAAQRREMINQEMAQLEVSKVQLQRELQEQTLRRKVDIEKAQAQAEVNRILGASMTSAYVNYRELEVLEKLADSDNKVFVPLGALNSVAVQNQIGK